MAKQGTLLDIRDIVVAPVGHEGPGAPVLQDVSMSVERGSVTALIGESGSGKTTLALAALRYTKPGLEILKGNIVFDGEDLNTMPSERLRKLRSTEIAYVAQSAAAAFNPASRLIDQVIESTVAERGLAKSEARQRAYDLMDVVQLPNPKVLGDCYPHELSGGQLQRMMLVMALCPQPKLLLLDEPTTALDVTTQLYVLKSIKDAIASTGTSAIYVSHDLAVVSQVADDVIVLFKGSVRETGSIDDIIHSPKDEYTKQLIHAVESSTNANSPGPDVQENKPVLDLRDVSGGYNGVKIVDDFSITANRGEIVALIGESGSGKSTIAKVIAGLAERHGGEVHLNGQGLGAGVSDRTKNELRRIQYVPQMADTALNPYQSIRSILHRPIRFFGDLERAREDEKVARILDLMHLPQSILDRHPMELSGGQKQRVNLARALVAEPDVLLCDEVTSALDVIVAAAIVKLLKEVRDATGVTILFISHDINTVANISDRIVVMFGGKMVELGQRTEALSPPYHPYTRELLKSTPELHKGWLEEATRDIAASSFAPVQSASFAQCRFVGRCPIEIPDVCQSRKVPRIKESETHAIWCHTNNRID